MKLTSTLFFICFSLVTFAQHSVSVKPQDFKKIDSNKVSVEMIVDSPLSSNESANLTQWVSDNESRISVKSTSSTSYLFTVEADILDKNVFLKLWYMMGVNTISFKENGQNKTMSNEEFLSHIGL